MPIMLAVLLMTLLIGVGSRSKKLRLGQYALVFLITLAQVCILVIYMYTIGLPPSY
jgi:hypothetical protein